MSPDYDLSDLTNLEADVWLRLHADAIGAEIIRDRAARQASGQSLRRRAARARRKQRDRGHLSLWSSRLGRNTNWEALNGALLEPSSRRAAAFRSSGFVSIPAVSRWVH